MQYYTITKGNVVHTGHLQEINNYINANEISIYKAMTSGKLLYGWKIEKAELKDITGRRKILANARRVLKAMDDIGMDLDELSFQTDIPKSRLKDFKVGSVDLIIGEYLQIARVLGVTACCLTTGEEYDPTEEENDNG